MKNSKIEWTYHTFNPWWGCTKVHDGCRHCYAETLSNRFHKGIWGHNANRRFFEGKHWEEPNKWNRQAERNQERRRVFCGSMCDIAEDRKDLDPYRQQLFAMIENTPWLDWLLLTKRPENLSNVLPDHWLAEPRHNVWLGTSPCNQKTADIQVPQLVMVPATVRFLSIEPLIGPITELELSGIQWVIVGGESGVHSREMRPDWVRGIRDACNASDVPFFFKQWGGRNKHEDKAMLDNRIWHQYPLAA